MGIAQHITFWREIVKALNIDKRLLTSNPQHNGKPQKRAVDLTRPRQKRRANTQTNSLSSWLLPNHLHPSRHITCLIGSDCTARSLAHIDVEFAEGNKTSGTAPLDVVEEGLMFTLYVGWDAELETISVDAEERRKPFLLKVELEYLVRGPVPHTDVDILSYRQTDVDARGDARSPTALISRS